MKINYATDTVRKQCTSVKAANKLFGGNKKFILGLHSRINAIKNAENIKDIICIPQFRFHNLSGNIDEICEVVKIVEIKEVSPHYE